MKKLACAVTTWWTGINREPIGIIVFIVGCAAFIAIGCAIGKTTLFLLIITTALSVDSSLMGRLVAFQQGKDSGEIEA